MFPRQNIHKYCTPSKSITASQKPKFKKIFQTRQPFPSELFDTSLSSLQGAPSPSLQGPHVWKVYLSSCPVLLLSGKQAENGLTFAIPTSEYDHSALFQAEHIRYTASLVVHCVVQDSRYTNTWPQSIAAVTHFP
jgi:hypothetical protein